MKNSKLSSEYIWVSLDVRKHRSHSKRNMKDKESCKKKVTQNNDRRVEELERQNKILR